MDKYAIIKAGGKQYRVQAGDIIDVELLQGERGNSVEFKEVLFSCEGTQVKVGLPLLSAAVVRGTLVDLVRGPKVIAYKYRKRKKSRRKVGHRQHYARVKITELAI